MGLTGPDEDELRSAARFVELSQGHFALAFVECNHPSLTQPALARLGELLDGHRLDVVKAVDGGAGLAAQLEASAGEPPPDAQLVVGLDQLIDPVTGTAPLVEGFNLSRDHVMARFRWPVLLWASSAAMAAFPRHAPDFWSGRVAVFELLGGPEDVAATVEATAGASDWAVAPEERARQRQRLAAVVDQLGEVDVTPEGRATALLALGRAEALADRYEEAEGRYGEALPIFRALGDRLGEADLQLALGRLARARQQWPAAGVHLREALGAYRQLQTPRNEALAAEDLAGLAQATGDAAAAAEWYRVAAGLFELVGQPQAAQRNRDAAARHRDVSAETPGA